MYVSIPEAVGNRMTDDRRSDSQSTYTIPRLIVLLLIAAMPLKAYADPGSGLMIWQIAGAFFLGCLYQVQRFLVRIRKRK
jgi:hypothetical protein